VSELAAEERLERRWVLIAGAVVVAIVVALALAARELRAEKLSRVELVRKCLVSERGFATGTPGFDAVGLSTTEGVVSAWIETNLVSIVLVESEEEAQEIEAAYLRTARDPEEARRRTERRGLLVYRWWENDPSPTQQQAAYNCSY
jgi:hypothetical protein